MQETSPGQFAVTLRLSPGRHYYVFVVNGARVVDPYNTETAHSSDDMLVSTFVSGKVISAPRVEEAMKP